MTDYIDKNIAIFNKIIDFYKTDDLKQELKTISENISNALDSVIKANAESYKLVMSNSVSKKNLFKVEYRLKGDTNLKEKFIRKNEGFKFLKSAELMNLEDVDEKPDIVKKHIKLLDDVIGIKILTELKADCKNVHMLLQDKIDELGKRHIKLLDIMSPPSKMKNGLDIYKYKGVYYNECHFELQIKSKIDSAWGDLDHTLFYKEYTFNPIRNTVQVSMNRIGLLLNELEEFLYDIRRSNSEYEDKAEILKYSEILYSGLTASIKGKLGHDYDITTIATHLIYFHKLLGFEMDKALPIVDFKCIGYNSDDLLHRKYLKVRNEDFKLIILEATYMSWREDRLSETITEYNYKEVLNTYLDALQSYLIKQAIVIDPRQDESKVNDYFKKTMPMLLDHSASSKIYMSPQSHLNYIAQSDMFNAYWEHEESNDDKNKLLLASCLLTFDCDCTVYLRSINCGEFDPNTAIKMKKCIADIRSVSAINADVINEMDNNLTQIIKSIGLGDDNV